MLSFVIRRHWGLLSCSVVVKHVVARASFPERSGDSLLLSEGCRWRCVSSLLTYIYLVHWKMKTKPGNLSLSCAHLPRQVKKRKFLHLSLPTRCELETGYLSKFLPSDFITQLLSAHTRRPWQNTLWAIALEGGDLQGLARSPGIFSRRPDRSSHPGCWRLQPISLPKPAPPVSEVSAANLLYLFSWTLGKRYLRTSSPRHWGIQQLIAL